VRAWSRDGGNDNPEQHRAPHALDDTRYLAPEANFNVRLLALARRASRLLSPELIALRLGDTPDRWEALGFSVEDGVCPVGGVALQLGAPGRGITGWAVTGLEAEVDGLPDAAVGAARPPATHPNGATGIDHVVVMTPDFDRTTAALEAAGIELRRVVKRPDENRMGFRRLGPAILELVEVPELTPGPARFWGLVVVVADLDALAERLGDHLGAIHDAVQPGRRIASLRRTAGLGQAVAFMSAGAVDKNTA
jgi:hypothetical protein